MTSEQAELEAPPPGLGYAADVGERENQEDNLGYRPLRPGVMAFALADGMGGHVGGEVASGLAVQAFLDHLGRYPSAGPDRWPQIMGEALIAANNAIRVRILEDEQFRGMGCTLVGVISDGKRFSYVSVGDSPLFLSTVVGADGRQGKMRLVRINTDHSMRTAIEEKSRATGISIEELSKTINPNALRSALIGQDLDPAGMQRANELDVETRPLHEGDRIVVASDGIDTLPREELARVANTRDRSVHAQAADLVAAVKACGKPGQDNTSLIIYAAPEQPARRGQRLFRASGKPAGRSQEDPTHPMTGGDGAAGAGELRDTKVIFTPPGAVMPEGSLTRTPPAVAKLRLQSHGARRQTSPVLQWFALALGIGMLIAVAVNFKPQVESFLSGKPLVTPPAVEAAPATTPAAPPVTQGTPQPTDAPATPGTDQPPETPATQGVVNPDAANPGADGNAPPGRR